MPTTGVNFTDEQWDEIERLRREGVGPIELEHENSIPSRSEVVRVLVSLGLGAIQGWEGADWTMSVENAKHETRMATLDAKRDAMRDN